jgi:uncharacterized sulfatase
MNSVMSRRALTLGTAVTAALSAFPASMVAAQSTTMPPRRPNVLFILVDDMGYGDLAAWGDHAIRTPNLDRLAAEGVRISHFYSAAPICSPSRTAFTTGQYPQRWRITSFLADRRSNAMRGMADCLDAKAPTLARCLHDAGYAAGHFGKWHMGGQRDFGDAPLITAYGFDQSLTQFEGLGDRILPIFSRRIAPKSPGGRYSLGIGSEKLGQGKCEYVDRWEVTGRFVKRAINFIEAAKKSGKPFYVNLWTDDPHTPVEPSPPYRGDYSPRTRYHGVLRELDRDLGQLIGHIRNDPALRDNTIIIFASDNGPEEGYGSNGNLRGHKGQLYEGGIREPFIVWAPRLVNPERIGKTNTTSIVGAIDLAPTLLSILDVKTPDGVAFDGLDMSDVFLGRSTAAGRPAPLFWSRPPDRPGPAKNTWPDFAIRDGKWKLLVHAAKSPELYDIAADPGEMINKAEANPQIAAGLAAKLAAWRKAVNCEEIYKPNRATDPGFRD